tara:strand:- start:192 stop:341 length:150 start_codon:yes stop_codon:yes gene_type:complete
MALGQECLLKRVGPFFPTEEKREEKFLAHSLIDFQVEQKKSLLLFKQKL